MRLALLLALLLGPSLATAAPAPSATVETGRLSGIADGGVEAFKAIPYAAPPLGALRWRAPQPAKAWSGVRPADAFGPMCMQPVTNEAPRAAMSEDCLTLNVFRPVGAKNLPVMVWIHGGALITGAASLPTYDGAAFAKGGVVLVSINYRLGRLGFFAHPVLSAENADDGRLVNYGLLDQIAALKWVQRNIAALGGDPGNVTIFGESSGGLSVNGLMIAPEARGLFHRAISQSGYGRGPFPRLNVTAPDGQPSAEAEGIETVAKWGVAAPTLAALRALPAQTISDIPGGGNFYLDGKVITRDLWAAFRDGAAAPVPFMIGSNGLEFAGNPNAFRPIERLMSRAEEAELVPYYGARPGNLEPLASDLTYAQQARALARFHVANGHKAFVYLFDFTPASETATSPGVRHAAELRYVFDTLGTGRAPVVGEDASRMAKLVNAHWRAFAKTGSPNAAGLPAWPAYDGATIMQYRREGAAAAPDARNDRLDAISRLLDGRS